MRRDHPIARGEIGSKSPENPGEHLENPADLYWWMDECARRGGSIALTHRLALKQRDLTTYGTPGAARRRPVHEIGRWSMADLDYRKYWDAAFPWSDYLAREVREHPELWNGVWQRARVPEWAREEAAPLGAGWKLLVISEDWCGDASNTVPVVAKLGEELGWEVRVVKRDENPELMDAYLTSGSRSIPMTLVLRDDFTVAGQWGPRPAELQSFVLTEKRAGTRP